ncbi:MAG: uroporphyrinogen-III synthase [Anaerolineales bacterium]|nr:uroporphyrinogen-III synthase [Anaerolineales bacterium]
MNILITRPRTQSAPFANALQAAGFTPIFFPVIEIRPMDDYTVLDRALAKLACYDWVVFTSVNGVEAVWNRLSLTPGPSPLRGGVGVRVAAIGPKTAEALQSRGVTPDFVPEEYVAEAILPGLGDLRGKWVLLPRAEIARKALPETIAKAGGIAHEIAVYQTLPAMPDPDGLAAIRAGVDWLTFTSPSTVHNFVEIVRRASLEPLGLPAAPKVACIGPITESAAREEGFKVDLVAEQYTTEGLIRAMRGALRKT